MRRKRNSRVFGGALVLVVAPVLLWAYSSGPDAGYTAAPADLGDCTSCHLGRVNSNGGNVSVAFPNGLNYVPGTRQHLTLTITDSTQRAWGFELTARLASSLTTQAGTLAPSDANTTLMCSTANFSQQQQANACPGNLPLQYVEHTLAGYQASFGHTGSWTYQFDWTPPPTNVGNVVVYVAANAANGDMSTSGDHIYTTSYTLTPSTGGGNTPTISEVDNAFSNIANSPIQSGTWVAIKGTNLSTTNPGRGWNANESFPTSMDGTSVTINNKPAFVYYISPTQVNVQAPTDASLGPVSVVVNNNGAVSAAATATYQTNAPALLQWGGGQFPYALISRGSQYIGNPAVIPQTFSAHAGDVLTLWATGLGATNPPVPAGQQPTTFPSLTMTPTVTVGGANVTVLGAVLRFAGLYQVNIQLPASMPTGDQPIKIIQGSFQSPAGILLNIQ